MKKNSKLLLILIPFFLMGSGIHLQAQNMTAAPHMIILNASGISLDFKTIWSGYLAGGSTIVSQSIQLHIDGELICEAYDLTYCWTDANFIATFDRYLIVNNSFVQSLANIGQSICTISGSYTTMSASGNLQTFTVNTHFDYIEIVQPTGKKK